MSNGTIIYIGGFEFPEKNAASLRAMGNAKLLRSLNYNVVLIGVDKKKKWGEAVNYSRYQNFDIWSEPYPNGIIQLMEYTTSIKNFMEVAGKYNDIKMVICYDYQAFAFSKIKSFCKTNNIRIIADSTEWYSAKGMGLVKGTFKAVDVFYRMRILQKKLDGLITVSRYLYQYYSKSLDCIIIPPTVDPDDSKWNCTIEKTEDQTLRMVYAGSPGYIKDKLNVIIKIIASLDSSILLCLDIIGVEKEEYLNSHLEDSEIVNCSRVRFRGRLSHQECIQKITNADYFIFWRDDNIVTRAGFPSKLVESLSCGTPVITTKTSNVEDYLFEGKNGFLLDFDEAKAQDKLCEIIMMGKRKAFELKSYCQKHKSFDYRNFTDHMSIFLEKVIDNHVN